MLETNELNPSQIGLITECKCQLFLIEHGFNVLLPVGNYQKYDLVIEKDNKFFKIQIKHACKQENSFLVRTKFDIRNNGKVCKKKYSKEDCDFFMTEFENKFYIFPNFETTETKFWLIPPNNHYPTAKKAEDFLAENFLAKL